MTNREWLQKMALIDLLDFFIQNSDQCVLCMLGYQAYTDRCDRVFEEDKGINENCYNCICSWLNEEKIF